MQQEKKLSPNRREDSALSKETHRHTQASCHGAKTHGVLIKRVKLGQTSAEQLRQDRRRGIGATVANRNGSTRASASAGTWAWFVGGCVLVVRVHVVFHRGPKRLPKRVSRPAVRTVPPVLPRMHWLPTVAARRPAMQPLVACPVIWRGLLCTQQC